jgi:hypothetical protein
LPGGWLPRLVRGKTRMVAMAWWAAASPCGSSMGEGLRSRGFKARLRGGIEEFWALVIVRGDWGEIEEERRRSQTRGGCEMTKVV